MTAEYDPSVPYIPSPEMKVIEEMQNGIVMKLADIQRHKSEGTPVVWTSILTPKEILYAMDVPTVSGNLLGAYASIFGSSAKYCQQAEDQGLSRDVCSLNRCGLGVGCSDDRDEFFSTAFAVPDLAIGSNFPCASEGKAFLHAVKKYNIPYYFLDSPINTWGTTIPEHAVRYAADQLQGMIDFLVRHGFRFDPARLREEVAFSKAVNAVLEEFDTYRRAVPCPIRAYDSMLSTIAPIALSKESRTLKLFESMRDELKDRVARGHAVIENERLRLLWLGVPPLYDFLLLNYPEKHGAVVVKHLTDFITGIGGCEDVLDPARPLESIALAQLLSPSNPTSESLIRYFVKMVKDYRVDGVVSTVMRSCAMVPGAQRFLKDTIYRETGVPSVLLDLEGFDQREYDPAGARAQIDAFVETLLARKAA
jgi:benzoyl-CoA reductase/2-hydroxyglutaryl-CoA dehydratase subunit BcrC/BadD/HgdB